MIRGKKAQNMEETVSTMKQVENSEVPQLKKKRAGRNQHDVAEKATDQDEAKLQRVGKELAVSANGDGPSATKGRPKKILGKPTESAKSEEAISEGADRQDDLKGAKDEAQQKRGKGKKGSGEELSSPEVTEADDKKPAEAKAKRGRGRKAAVEEVLEAETTGEAEDEVIKPVPAQRGRGKKANVEEVPDAETNQEEAEDEVLVKPVPAKPQRGRGKKTANEELADAETKQDEAEEVLKPVPAKPQRGRGKKNTAEGPAVDAKTENEEATGDKTVPAKQGKGKALTKVSSPEEGEEEDQTALTMVPKGRPAKKQRGRGKGPVKDDDISDQVANDEPAEAESNPAKKLRGRPKKVADSKDDKDQLAKEAPAKKQRGRAKKVTSAKVESEAKPGPAKSQRGRGRKPAEQNVPEQHVNTKSHSGVTTDEDMSDDDETKPSPPKRQRASSKTGSRNGETTDEDMSEGLDVSGDDIDLEQDGPVASSSEDDDMATHVSGNKAAAKSSNGLADDKSNGATATLTKQTKRLVLQIEACVFGRRAQEILAVLQETLPDLEMSLNKERDGSVKKPRKGAFELSLLLDDGQEHQLWSGLKRGPPRAQKFPHPTVIKDLLLEVLD